MKRFILLITVCALACSVANASSEQDVVNDATSILRNFRSMPESDIPASVLRHAKGLAILTVVKVGFGFSGKGGQGVVVARNGGEWSGPSFIGTGGAGFGFQIGAQVTQFVFVLNNSNAVRAFSQDGNVTLGADVSAAAGPVGRDLQAGVTPTAAIYAYSRSQGLFAGASLEGAVIGTQKDSNARYYGRRVSSREILSGRVPPPRKAARLLAQLRY
jgi:SH3 domain-containing YSC84-like protein 1